MMNNSMHIVGKIWYRLYLGAILLFCVGIVAGTIVIPHLAGLEGAADNFGLNTTTLTLASITALYCLSLFWLIYKRQPPTAMLIASLLFTLLLLAGMTTSSPSSGFWLFTAVWAVNVLFSGMYGASALFGSLFLAVAFVLTNDNFALTKINLPHAILIAITGAMVAIGYFFWRKRLSDPVNHQLNQLAGALRNKDEQAAILIQSIADGVIVTNTEGKITLMNRTAANMTGWAIEDASGINIEQVFQVASEKGEAIAKEDYPFTAVLTHKAFFNHVLQLTSRDGHKKTISLVISPVVTPTGEVFGAVAVLRDISEQRAAEQQRAEFVSTASHEMRTPVAAIEGYLALALNDKVSTIDDRARNYLQKAHASTQHLGQLFQDLLTSAKAEDGRLSNHPTVVEMGSFLEQLVEDLRFGAQKKGLDTEFIVGSSSSIDATTRNDEGMKQVRPLYYVHVDADRIREVITNLFDNGVKYTQQGRISVGLTGNNDVVQLFIRDTGPGIPPEDVPHLFQKFYRVDNSATRTIGGTGLGLFITRKIIELYQGRIWVTSELGKGSTFYINLPRLTTQKAQELSAAEAAQAAAQPATPATPAVAPQTQPAQMPAQAAQAPTPAVTAAQRS